MHASAGARTVAPLHLAPRYGIDDLLALVNTQHGPAGHWKARPRSDGPDHDHLATATDARAWLVGHGVAVPDDLPDELALDELRRVRDVARSLHGGSTPEAAATVGGLARSATYRLAPDRGLVSASTGWTAVAEDMLPPLLELLDVADRVRRCGNPLCRFTFVDRSPAHRRQWCDSRGCGNRTRVRRSRARRAEQA